MRTIKIIYFIEHVEREWYLIDMLKERLSLLDDGKYMITPVLLNFLPPFGVFGECSVIVAPSENRYINKLASLSKVPVINLCMEQMLSELNRKLKIPRSMSKNADINICWSEEYYNFLRYSGVQDKAIKISNRPQLSLCLSKLRVGSAKDKKALTSSHQGKIVCYCPLTDLQAFKSDAEVRRIAKYSKISLKQLLQRKEWVYSELVAMYKDMQLRPDVFFIVRPHPSVAIKQHYALLIELFDRVPENVFVSDKGNVYDYFSKSDIIVSNYSSVLLESRALGIPSYIFQYNQIPEFMKYDWMENFKKIPSFIHVDTLPIKCLSGNANNKESGNATNKESVDSILFNFLISNTDKTYKISLSSYIFSIFSRRGVADMGRSLFRIVGIIGIKHKKDCHDFIEQTR
jgi:hypothetical protein